MMLRSNIVWLGPVVNDMTLTSYLAVSPAANRWQKGLIQGLKTQSANIFNIGHIPEPLWPRGRLRMNADSSMLAPEVDGALASYWNLPGYRERSLTQAYLEILRRHQQENGKPAVLITYNSSPVNAAIGRYVQKVLNIPWVCIVADDKAPDAADGYIFLSWGYYSNSSYLPKLHLDGGVSTIRSIQHNTSGKCTAKSSILYSGAMNKFGGVSFLVNAFHQIRNPNLELWLCGKGTNVDIDRIATIDPRVKRFGYVTEKHLQQLSRDATLFVNPRPASVPGNEKNFPSKVLEYLSYGKPVVSTWTEGLAPDYREVLIVLAEETEACLVHTLEDVLGWEQPRRLDMAAQIKNFLETRKLWNIQANRLFVWLRQYVLPKDYIL